MSEAATFKVGERHYVTHWGDPISVATLERLEGYFFGAIEGTSRFQLWIITTTANDVPWIKDTKNEKVYSCWRILPEHSVLYEKLGS